MPRNVVFLLIDCLRVGECYGETGTTKTPNIDLLRCQGTTFTQAISTVPVTTPAVTTILTGLYPFGHGVRSLEGYKLNPGIKTLAQIFSENGYATYAEVVGPLMPQIGISKGFDHYHLRDSRTDNMYSSWYDDLLARFVGKQFHEPYFIFIHFFEIHVPRLVARGYDNGNFGKNRYERALSSLDARLGKLLDCIGDNTVIILHADHGEKIAQTGMQQWLFRIFSHCYSRYYLRLKRKFVETQPRIYLTGHGFNLRDYLLRVPLIFVGKGVFPAGKVVSDQVTQVDIFPTIVEALGLKHGTIKTHGRSLLPLINSKHLSEIPAYCEVQGPLLPKSRWLAGIRTSKYKYIFTPYADNIADELYDLEKDPNEKRNIMTKRPEVARELKQWLQEIRITDEAAVTKRKIQRLKAHGKI